MDEGAIILTMMQPAYDNLEKELDLDSWHEKLCLKFFVTRVSDMKSVVISDLSHPNRDLDDGSFVFEPEPFASRIPELFAHDEGNQDPARAGMKATFFAQSGASEMQVNLSYTSSTREPLMN